MGIGSTLEDLRVDRIRLGVAAKRRSRFPRDAQRRFFLTMPM